MFGSDQPTNGPRGLQMRGFDSDHIYAAFPSRGALLTPFSHAPVDTDAVYISISGISWLTPLIGNMQAPCVPRVRRFSRCSMSRSHRSTRAAFDACRVRRGIAACKGAGVLRCEPLMGVKATCSSGAPRARLMIRLPFESYASVLHCLLECAPDGEIGHLTSWREHLERCGIANGG